VRSTRRKDGALHSNIIASYGHTTIPRHLRDIAITEYGIADLRGRTDAECIAAMLNIADSRFQERLLGEAKRAGKIDAGYRIPDGFRDNTPERLERAFEVPRRAGRFSEYPFGTDLTREEIGLARALRWLKEHTEGRWARMGLVAQALLVRPASPEAPYLARLGLAAPRKPGERVMAGLVTLALRATPEAAGQTTARDLAGK
jgi:Acetyl-CoA hydrolase/transferase C-terminal domain